MKLEEGMYVRTIYGITQYKEYETQNGKLLCMPIKSGANGIFANIEDIIGEPSHNIIDLIEVGDYVNGVEVEDINDKEIMLVDTHLWIDKEVANRLIETIVTKEQFEKESYKVGD